MDKKISIVELFSGIGSQAKALKCVAKKRGYKMDSLNTCEWDIHSIVAYDYIHNGPLIDKQVQKLSRKQLLEQLSKYNLSNDGKQLINKKFFDSLDEINLRNILSSIKKTNNLVNIEDIKPNDLPDDIDILTYSFPCQDLSNVGALHGYNKGIDKDSGSRSSLLWKVGTILQGRVEQGLNLPKFLLLENVTALETKRHAKNFEEWQQILNELGYINKVYKLYAPDFGIPQNRTRLLMLSVLSNETEIVDEYFRNHNLNDKEYIKNLGLNRYKLEDLLKIDMDDEKWFKEALIAQPNNTKSRETIWAGNLKIVNENNEMSKIVATITTKQDRHPNSGNIYFDYTGNTKSKYRFLTPRECFLLMGFKDKDYDILLNNNFKSRSNSLFFSRDRLYKFAGNSIVVNVLKAIFDQVIDLKEILIVSDLKSAQDISDHSFQLDRENKFDIK